MHREELELDETRRRPYLDRKEAGQVLAQALYRYLSQSDLLVLGLVRGGVPVAYEVAKGLNAQLDALQVRKLGVPGQEELAMGAVASGGIRVVDENFVLANGIGPEVIDAIAGKEEQELVRKEELYRDRRRPVDPSGKTVILVDDGIATGASMRAAVAAVRTKAPAAVVVGVPVGSRATCEELRSVADDVVCPRTPRDFFAVSQWYKKFDPVTDDEVRSLLYMYEREHAQRTAA
jgi:putative phosphoribosyl transferase